MHFVLLHFYICIYVSSQYLTHQKIKPTELRETAREVFLNGLSCSRAAFMRSEQDKGSAMHNMRTVDFEKELRAAFPAVDRCTTFSLPKFACFMHRGM